MNDLWLLLLSLGWLLIPLYFLARLIIRWTVGSYFKNALVRVGKVLHIRWMVKMGKPLKTNPKFKCKGCGDIFLQSEAMEHDCRNTVFHERLEKR